MILTSEDDKYQVIRGEYSHLNGVLEEFGLEIPLYY